MKIPAGGEVNAAQPSRFELTEENVANALVIARRSTPALRWGEAPWTPGDFEKLLAKGSGPAFCAWTGPKEDEVYAALTGNGPTSEVNALFFAHARDIVIALIEERTRLRAVGQAACEFLEARSWEEDDEEEKGEALADAVNRWKRTGPYRQERKV